MAQAASPQAIAEYKRKLKEYLEARAAFDEEAGAYWSSISEKRRGRNAKRRDRQQITLDDYVLTQPPIYDGPNGRSIRRRPSRTTGRPRKTIPVVADLLKAARSISSSRRNGRRTKSSSSAPTPARRRRRG